MCGRYSLIGIDDLGARFRITDPSMGFRSRFNIAPGSFVPVIVRRERTEAVLMAWGLVPRWTKDQDEAPPIINARAETISQRPSFRHLLKSNRCLVPATGFFEWKKDQKRKTPFYIRMQDRGLFAFAGLYDIWHDPAGNNGANCTIITTWPNELVAPIHNRMPAILGRSNETRWLSGESLTPADLAQFLVPFPAAVMEAYPVLPLVNNQKIDDERLIRPLAGL
jgi:putative SOS response-associated peptidase YedK